MKNKSLTVSGNFTFSNHFLDTSIAHKISSLTECNAPDLSSEKYNWINRFLLNAAFVVRLPNKDKALLFNFVRRVEGACTMYNLARTALVEYISTPQNTISPYFKALLHYEVCIAQVYQGAELLSKVNETDVFKKGDGSLLERINKIYVDSKHMDEIIDGGKTPDKATAAIWLTNEGIESARASITYDDLAGILHDLNNAAKEVATITPKK